LTNKINRREFVSKSSYPIKEGEVLSRNPSNEIDTESEVKMRKDHHENCGTRVSHEVEVFGRIE
jgi:hypothetical protein